MKSFDLHVKMEQSGKDYRLIELSGFLDAHTVNSFENEMEEIGRNGIKKIVIDLQNLNYISSAGIGALMALTQKLRREKGDLVLLKPNDKVFKILDLLGFTKIFNVARSDDQLADYMNRTEESR